MKKILSLIFGLIICSTLFGQITAPDSIRVSLAEWTFDQWFGAGILPPGQTANSPVPADRGTVAETALIGTEQMFAGGAVNRVWSVATTGGYIRCSRDWSANSGQDRYYKITGINTIGSSSVRLTSSHATSSSSLAYGLTVQYRIGPDGEWKYLYGPFSVTSVTESGISGKQVDNVLLPEECNNAAHLDVRWLCTTFPSSASTQFRIDNVYLTVSVANPEPDADLTPLATALSLNEDDWTVPSWTLLLSARKKAHEAPLSENLNELTDVLEALQPKGMPYAVNASFNGDPSTHMGFAWYTNAGEFGGQLQIVAKQNASVEDFENPLFILDAETTELFNVNYIVASNDPTFTADLPVNAKRDYVSNKAQVADLTPGTHYSYRVGKEDSWSAIRRFRTAQASKDTFSFIYVCDTQSNSNDNFDVSARTLTEAYNYANNPLFLLMSGDLVESQGGNNSEWEYEQFFERIDNVWSELPLVATIGNHDASSSNNFFHHINNDVSYNQTASVPSNMNGTNYSFVVGNALFMIVNHEDRTRTGYLESLGEWMTEQVNAHPDVQWRIVGVHTGLFSGGSHHNNSTIADMRDVMLPYYDELNIDISFQGHDHTYNVMGPVNNITRTVVPGSVTHLGTAPTSTANMTGKTGGVYDVSNGTLYFINNAASRKKYSPRNQGYMFSNESVTRVPNYWGLFTGMFGQTGEPTFSTVDVTSNEILISTYAINNTGETYLLDEIIVTKGTANSISENIEVDFKVFNDIDSQKISIQGIVAKQVKMFNLNGQLLDVVKHTNVLTTADLQPGIYIIRVYSEEGVYVKKIAI